MVATYDSVWTVVGGSAKGGIIVRTGKEKNSPECPHRLSTGSKVRVVDGSGTRVCYELLHGEGPEKGWVASALNGNDLLVRDEVTPSHDALEEYCRRFGRQQLDHSQRSRRKFLPQYGHESVYGIHLREQAQGEMQSEMGLQQGTPKSGETRESGLQPSRGFQLKGWARDADGDDVRVCMHCSLPLGNFSHLHGEDYVHGECKAQLTVQALRSEENARVEREQAKKSERHAAYGIGWVPEHLSRNRESASKLAMRDVPEGMVCLVSDENLLSVHAASTTEPSAAINLEYLSTALQVRRADGHEPVFSLDPLNPRESNSMQQKVFVPDWLAGTKAGEVLFQADYHLKELFHG